MLLGPGSAFPAVFSPRKRTYWRPVLSGTPALLANHRLQSFMLNVILAGTGCWRSVRLRTGARLLERAACPVLVIAASRVLS
jgi:hypothetical protein